MNISIILYWNMKIVSRKPTDFPAGKWRHTSGFSAHDGMQIRRDDEQGKEALAQYIIRNPFLLEKITYKPESGIVVYRSKTTHGKNKANFKVFDALEFIAAITQHIFQMY